MRIFFRDTESGEYYDQTNQLSLAELQSVKQRVQTDTNKIPELIEKLDSDESVEQKAKEYKKLFLKKDIEKTVRELMG